MWQVDDGTPSIFHHHLLCLQARADALDQRILPNRSALFPFINWQAAIGKAWLLDIRFVGQLNDFQVFDFSSIDGKSNQCADLMKARNACSSRIDMQTAQRIVVENLKNTSNPQLLR